jgi:multisite-specific tRNA:(cytosine-C5)-methyltransferase
MTTPKAVIRKFPPFASFQKFLVSETEVGNISRQEIVSMIPPLLMGIEPHMTVLDLCAAPGSKTAQMIEMLHAGEEDRMRAAREAMTTNGGSVNGIAEGTADSGDDDGRSTGLLVANDVDYKRAHMLIHQTKRLNSPNLIVTNHDATMFPSIRLPSDQAPDGIWHPNKYLKFDRILADVPCSGDGTSRKNPEIWTKWTPGNALGLHVIQARILVRALQMLKVGGRVVYSTCSMNPIENEAVVASAIDRCGGSTKVQLIDCKDELPGLKRHNGFTDWPVMDKSGRIWKSWKELEEHRHKHGEEGLERVVENMFAPPKSDTSPQLQYCMRVYPHMQDTGGFFIAVLEKKSEIRAKPEAEPKKPEHEHIGIGKALEGLTNREYEGKRIDAFDEKHPSGPEPGGTITAAERLDEPDLSDSSSTSKRKRAEAEQEEKEPPKRLKVTEPSRQYPPMREPHYYRHYPPPPGAMRDQPSTSNQHNPSIPVIQTVPQPKKKRDAPFEEPFKYLPPTHPELLPIFSFYQISSRFPKDRFMVRNASGNPSKTIYYTSTLARDILTENEGKGLKFVHCGVKMFVKQDVQSQDTCPWRIQTDGLPIVESWVGEDRVVYLTERETLRKLLVEMFPKVGGDGWKGLAEIGERVRDIKMGCCVLRVELAEGKEGLRFLPISMSQFFRFQCANV